MAEQDIDAYGLAYVCGGPRRVVLVGRTVGTLTATAAAASAVTELGEALRERQILARRPWQLGRKLRVHALRRRLRTTPPRAELERIAVIGPATIADEQLRTTVTTPDPDLEVPKIEIPGMPDHNDRPYDAVEDARTALRLDAFGPGGPWSGL
jgi:hypothetical protein